MQVAKPKKGFKIVKTMFETYEEIPEDWKLEKISNLSKVSTGGTPSTSNQQYWKNGNIPWINSGEIQDNNVTNSSKYITKAGLESKHLQKLPKNTVVIGITGYVGKVGILTFETTTNQSVTGIFPSQKFISKFLFYFLISRRQYILRFSVATAQLHINQQVVKNLLIFLPPLPEQKQIATILSSVDDAIQKTNQIIDQTQRLKKGMMQKLLTRGVGHTKFKKTKIGEIPEEWEIKKIKDVSKLLVPLRDKPKEFVGNIPWLTLKDFDGKYVSKSKRGNNVTLETVKKMNLTIFPVGTVVYSISATIGICSITTAKLITNQRFIGVVPTPKIDKEFLYYFLNTQKENILRVGTGSIHSYTSKDQFGKLIIVIPPLPEQQQIVSILSNIDTQIQKEKIHKSNLERLKKGLMQKLLTGQIRVKV